MNPPGHTDTVLVVDDEPDSLRMLSRALEAADISVLIATSGQTALDLLGHIVPDLIIMDAVMPGMDGFEVTTRIKKRPELTNIPVIFMTGLTESAHVVEAFEVGGIDYVRKPVNLSELVARVRVHMAQGRAVQASLASLDATGRMVMATDARGSLLWCTPGAEAAIGRVAESPQQGTLPPEVSGKLERLLARGAAVGSSVRFENGTVGSLEMVVIAHYRENEVLIRLNELNPDRDVEKLRDRLALTQREAEVLLWVSYGKASLDISEVLAISPRTVQKHLERIYEKLGVERRSAAAAIAVQMLKQ
ncbi:MAG: response regulator [Sphingomonadales bacterium]|nr:response regulator [Sphingomonadales bacterium]